MGCTWAVPTGSEFCRPNPIYEERWRRDNLLPLRTSRLQTLRWSACVSLPRGAMFLPNPKAYFRHAIASLN